MIRRKKILLVSANNHVNPYPVYPVGLAYLEGYLNKKLPGFQTTILDVLNTNFNDIKQFINAYDPGYIGVSIRNIDDINIEKQECFMDYYQDLVKLIRNGQSTIVCGGSGFSMFPEHLFKKLGVDFGICGDGEIAFTSLVQALENNQDFFSIPGLVYEVDGNIKINPPDWNKTNVDTCIHYDSKLVDYYWQNGGMINLQTRRGCPKNCVYCTYPLIEGPKVRLLDPEMIVDSISKLYVDNNVDYFFFVDSVFNTNDEFNYNLASKLIKSNMKIKWAAYFSPDNIDRELLKTLKNAGLTHIEFGTDSLSDNQLNNYRKTFSVSDVVKTSEICNELDIHYAHFLILGGIGESVETLKETFNNAKLIKNTVFFPFLGMRLYPGTKLQELAMKEGIINDKTDLFTAKYYVSSSINIEDIKTLANKTEQKWVFPDESHEHVMHKMRKKNKKGPLWEYLKK